MLNHIPLGRILFIDMETAPLSPTFEDLDKDMQKLWHYRTNHFKPEHLSTSDYYDTKASVYAEFGKIICISIGTFTRYKGADNANFRIKSFYNDDEKTLLTDFLPLLQTHFTPDRYYLCGHNIKEFDVPFLARRILINNLRLPPMLNISSLKPWEVPYVDTMQLWKFGEFRNFTSLALLTKVLGLPSPKTDLEGSQIASVYWNNKDLERIKNYCQQDVLAVAQILLRYKNLATISADKVEVVV